MFAATIVSYKHTWVPPLLGEASTIMCFVYVGLRFRPMKDNPYNNLEEEDYEEMGVVLEHEVLDSLKRQKEDGEAEVVASSVVEKKDRNDKKEGAVAVKRVQESDL